MRRAIRWAVLPLVAMTCVGVVPQAHAATKFTYYLHHKGGCADGAKPGEFLNLKNDAGDDDGCGSIGDAGLFGGELSSWTSDKASGAPAAVPKGAQVKAAIFMTPQEPGQIELTAELYAGKTLVGTGTSDAIFTVGLLGYDRYNISFKTTKPIAKGSAVRLSISGGTTLQWYWGYEDDHPSNFEISF